MIPIQYEIDENCSEKEFQNIIEKFLTKKRIIYAFIPEYYNDFLLELSSKFIAVKNITDDKYSFPKCVHTLGYIIDDELEFVFEFYERANLIRFVIATEIINLNEIDNDLEKFYDYFKENNIPHITVGPDQEFVTYYSS